MDINNRKCYFAENIKTFLNVRGMTQKQMAEALYVNPATITGWLNGRQFMSVSMLVYLADFMHVSIEDLLFRKITAMDYQICMENPERATIGMTASDTAELSMHLRVMSKKLDGIKMELQRLNDGR